MEHKHKPHSTAPAIVPKTFQRNGKWIEKPTKSEIHTCTCGKKYLKTRLDQALCHECTGKV